MALVLANRVQQTGTANTTVSFTLTGSVTGYQSFAVIGNTNTTYYSATDTSGNWEVGLGTYSTTGPTLTRTTIYASSNAGAAVTFSGTVTVFVTYPSGRSVNLDASGNVSALGTVTSGTWQGSTVGVAYGGTGVTSSSGANSVVLRDSNQNITVNRLSQSSTTVTAAGTTTTLNAASTFSQILNGTGGQTFQLPDATTLTNTTTFEFNNNATGTLTITNNAGTTVGTVSSGGAAAIALLSNGTSGGTWDVHAYIPESVTWGTNALALGSTVITGGTWNGGTVTSAYGGTGLTTFTAGNNAIYSTNASTLAAGTLPVLAGGTGVTTSTGSGNNVLSTSPTLVTPILGTPQSGNFSTGTFTWPTFNQNTTGTASNVTGIVAVANGGTGNTTAQAEMNRVAGATTSGQYLRGNGTNVVMSAIQAADVPTLNQNTTGTAANVTGTVAVANGGTGLTTAPTNGQIDIGSTGVGFVRTTLSAGTGITITNGAGSISIASSVSAVTSVTGTSPVVSSGGTTPAISLALGYGDTQNPYASKTANYFLAAPNGAAGVPTFRAVVAADIPTLNQNTTGSAGSVSNTVTFNNGGAGDASGTTYNGSVARTISYNSVGAPSTTGTNASGTWGINVTGSAGSAGTATSAGNLTGGNITGNYIVGNATSPNTYYLQFGDNTGWTYRFMTSVSGTPTERFRFTDGGAFNAVGAITQNGSQVLTAGNYNSYAPTLTGTGASGTWGINITGNAATVTNGLTTSNYVGYSTFTGKVTSGGNNGFANDVYYAGARNPIWSFGNASAYGLSYFQGTAGIGGADVIGLHPNGTATAAGSILGVTASYTQSLGSLRSPVFYDLDNTGYYVDPASTSNLSSVQINGTLNVRSSNALFMSSSNGAYQRADSRDESVDSRLHWYGVTTTGGTSNFRHAWYDGSAYFNVTASGGQLLFDRVGGSGYLQASGSLRAPVFYDSDDTTYYINPNGSSVVNGAIYGGSSASALFVGQYAGSTRGQLYNDTSGFGLLTYSGGWAVRVDYGTASIYMPGAVYSDTGMRAPIFYDANNTSYFVDPNGTSFLYALNVYGGGLYDSSTGYRSPLPGGAAYSTGASSVAGAIKIRLPVASLGSNTMMGFDVDVYTYDGQSFTIRCGGYNYSDASKTWYNVFAYMLSGNRASLNVRFGWDGTSQCVWIGELGSSWSYPQVGVSNFVGGYSGNSSGNFATGWTVSFESSSFYSVSQTQTVYPFAQSNQNAGALYSPIYYDYSNTGYYVDPAGTSNVNTLNAATSLTVAGNAVAVLQAGGVVLENGQTISSNYTMTSSKNGMSAGPITVATGVTVTIPTGSTWVVV